MLIMAYLSYFTVAAILYINPGPIPILATKLCCYELFLWLFFPFIQLSIGFYCAEYATKPVKKEALQFAGWYHYQAHLRCDGEVSPLGQPRKVLGTKQQFGAKKKGKKQRFSNQKTEIRMKEVGKNSASYDVCTTLSVFPSRKEYMISCYRNWLCENAREMSTCLITWRQGAALGIFLVEQLQPSPLSKCLRKH